MQEQIPAAAEQPTREDRAGSSFVPPALAGLALALALGVFAPRLVVNFRYDGLLIFAAGAAAAVLVLRLMVQREQRQALQRTVSQIVGEDSSPEVAITRILEALCLSHGWDAALEWKVDAEENRLEFRTGWGAHSDRIQAFIQESKGEILTGSDSLPGQVCLDDRPVWITDLNSLPHSAHAQSALGHGMVSGWAVPVRVGNKVAAVLEFYCHSAIRENREALSAVEAAAASLGQMRARSHEQGRAEELYRRQEILLDSVADGICGVDLHGLVTFANPAAARLLAADATSLAGKSVHELLHGFAPAISECGEDCTLRHPNGDDMTASGEDTIFRSDGSAFPAEYALTPILDQGRFSGAVLSFRDISQRFALDRLKDEFISTVSHELRTPLTSIRGALGLLSSGILGPVNDKATNLLRIALNNSDRLVRLINDVLDLERIQSGREPLVFRPVQLADIVRQAIDGMAPVAEAAGVQLIHDTTLVEISADPDRLIQILTNLLSNAVKFSPPNSTISVTLRPGVTGVTLSVIDHGRGIPADKLEAIFGRFQQVDVSDSRQKGGSGLGLAICRTIVLQHSGRIWAERNPIRGSTFRVFLPYQPTPVGPSDPLRDTEPGHGTILLASANAATRPQVAALLTRRGFRVVETATVQQTLAAVQQGLGAILLDTSLNGLNGWEILPLLRRQAAEARTSVVLMSVQNRQKPDDGAADAQGWAAKQLNEDALLGELAGALNGAGEKPRVLVVEDDVDLARIVGDLFSPESFSVQFAYSLHQAQDASISSQPQLLAVDIGMPDGDGFNLVDWLRQHEELAHLPLVVYSGQGFSASDRRQPILGPTHFLSRVRVQPQQIEALVLTMMRASRLMEEVAPPESPVGSPELRLAESG